MAVAEQIEIYEQRIKEWKKKLKDTNDPEEIKKYFELIFYYQFIIEGYKKIDNYKEYLDCNVNGLITEAFCEAEKQNNTQGQAMLYDISEQMQTLLDYSKKDYAYYTDVIEAIDTLRQKMHQQYPLQTLTSPLYQRVYIKLLLIDKQISTDLIYGMEEYNGQKYNRAHQLWLVKLNVKPLDIYSYIKNELSLFIRALNQESSHFNKSDKEKSKLLITELEKNHNNLIPYDNFEKSLDFLITQILVDYESLSSPILKGIIDCLIDFNDRIHLIGRNITDQYLEENFKHTSFLADMLKKSYMDLNTQLSSKLEDACTLERELLNGHTDNDKGFKVNQLNNRWSEVMYMQIMTLYIKRRAEDSKIHLSNGQAIKPKPPEEE